MKLIKNVLISLAISAIFTDMAAANDYTPMLKVEVGAGKKFFLSLEDVSAPTTVQIVDRAEFIWMEEKVAASRPFKKVFNLDSLPVGSYTLIIKSEEKETVQPITVTDTELILDEKARTEYYRPDFVQKRSNVHLSLLNPSNSVVRVFIVGPTGRKVCQDVIKDQLVIDLDYNLKQQPAGYYTVVVDNAREVFTKYIALR